MLEGDKEITKMIISSARSQDRGFNTVALSHNDILRTLKSQDRSLQSVAQSQFRVVQVLNRCMDLLRASPKPTVESAPYVEYPGLETAAEGHSYAISPNPPSSAALEQKQCRQQLNGLLGRLNVDQQADVATIDLSMQLSSIYTLSLASQDRFVALMKSPHLQTWLISLSSSVLHINGHMFSNEHEAR